MKILITNDDGIHGRGLYELAMVARQFGDVVIVAPDRERSACGHAMTLRDPLRVKEVEYHGLTAYAVNGVPVDCVNVGLTVAYPDGCDLILSGINYGPNLGFDITYSGTVAGAMEGAINGIHSIALSLAVFVAEAPAHWETASQWLNENFMNLVDSDWEDLTFLNVNIPSIVYEELRGAKVAEMGKRVYKDRVEKRDDPWGRPYYWQGGMALMSANQPNTDVKAVNEGFVSITPLSLNWTNRPLAEKIAHENDWPIELS
ncbi:MAG: 5'/3'-nucleotidase SurE [Armatimonadetes bacterium]|nr:5'/3'-nucleotidase SurE [Armatimonadota bacterium]MBS1701817.1 5'/3'-nucleotidase SurE [Armatimonadota bacterium]MBS1727317.1 5'/3'-nucleotidase SurE [Armatimonadota bacterium]